MITKEQNSLIAVSAFVELLAGPPKHQPRIVTNIRIVAAGGGVTLADMAEYAQQSDGKPAPLILIQPHPEADGIPLVGLIAEHNGQIVRFGECYPWLDPKTGKASLIPSDFKSGCYRMSAKNSLVHDQKPPKQDYDAAFEGIVSACNRFIQLQADRFEGMQAIHTSAAG